MSYGESLPDQVDRVANLSDAQADIFVDIRELYRERATIERDYAAKLMALAQKAIEKKNKKMALAVVGDDPSKQWNDDTLVQSTLENAYSKIIASFVNSQQEHLNLADDLNQAQFYQKVLADTDRIYSDRSKSKIKYDEECAEVETLRQKQERAQDDKHSSRAAKQCQQQIVDMHNAKNLYIMSTTVANNVKDRLFTEDLAKIENQHQHIQSNYITNVVTVLQHAQALQLSHHDALKNQASVVGVALTEINSKKDQAVFIEHNLRHFASPTDWSFEPCASHHDTAEINVEGGAKIFLQNKLQRSRAKLQELKPLLEGKRKEAEQAMSFVDAGSGNPSSGSVDAIDGLLDAQHQVTLYETSQSILETEIRIIETALGGDEGSQRPHSFKSSSFTIPTECSYCATSIWGLSKQGKTCKACGLSVHSKCELKVAADCSGVRGVRQKVTDSESVSGSSPTLSRSSSRASSTVLPTASSFTQSTILTIPEAEFPVVRVVYDFTPTSPFELAVHEGASVRVVEEDDGSGWVKVVDEDGGRGLVPASYIEAADATPAPASGAEQSIGSGQFVRGLYDYRSQGPDELDVSEGARIELTSGASGGRNYADGWWEGIDALGRKGIFPSNYVEPV
ncbi:hypothetical protein EDB92DRAFT_1947619 [Lactarius akahatsu]|uniref:Uncharacterized protein n=1 Tax=Lactarius akahatsu TaxID=416441 RepID=A0AAD4LD59_9AGAM|nr:hypothetical protein EDB92DRAFT_1947619 [Lactarius akahatsu]